MRFREGEVFVHYGSAAIFHENKETCGDVQHPDVEYHVLNKRNVGCAGVFITLETL